MPKLDKKAWEAYINTRVHQERVRAQRLERKKAQERVYYYRRLVPIPIIIGVIAAFLTWILFGSKILLEIVLSWVIGITIVGTILAYIKKN